MNTSDLTGELFELKFSFFKWLLFIILGICGWITLTIGLFDSTRISPAWLLFTIMLGVSVLLERFLYKKASIYCCIGGLILSIGLYQGSLAGDSNISFLFTIPIFLAGILLSNKEVIPVTAATIFTILLTTFSRNSIGASLQIAFEPIVIYLFCAFLIYFWNYQIGQYFYWAIDSQQKNYVRAESFYQQREKLSTTLLELNQAYVKLEHLNEALEEAREGLEKANRAKSTFLSNMSHELRTPLNVIIGYTSSMLEMPQVYHNISLPPIYRDDIQLIKDSGHYLVSLINDILDLSKIESGKLEIHPTRVNLPELFKGIIATSTGLLKGKPVQLQPQYPADLPEVYADPLRIRQVLLNLMSNAIKFTDSGSVALAARQEGDSVCITVTDTGTGIPENALATIFDRFQQIALNVEKRTGGTGLGLDISKQLVLMHGSDLTVTSKLGHGSSFSFRLPLAATIETGTPSEIIGDGIVVFSEVLPTDSFFTVLLVHSENNTRQIIRQALEHDHYVVIDTPHIEQALELAQTLLPDAVIMQPQDTLVNALQNDEMTAGIPVITANPEMTLKTLLKHLRELRTENENSLR